MSTLFSTGKFFMQQDLIDLLVLTSRQDIMSLFQVVFLLICIGSIFFLVHNLRTLSKRFLQSSQDSRKREREMKSQLCVLIGRQDRLFKDMGECMHNAGNVYERSGLLPIVGSQIGDIGHYLRIVGNEAINGDKRQAIKWQKWKFNDPNIEKYLETLDGMSLVELSTMMLSNNRTLQQCLNS